MNGFTEAVSELSREDEFHAALDFIADALRETEPEDVEKDLDEIAWRLLKLEIAAYRRGYEEKQNKGGHPASGRIKEGAECIAPGPGLRVIQGGTLGMTPDDIR
jgi:hypothetical protein